MRLPLVLFFLLSAVISPTITVTYHIEFGIPALGLTSGGPFVPDPLPAATFRLDYTGDFPPSGPFFFFLDDPRITALDPMEYAGYPLRAANSYIDFSNTGLQLIAFDFGPSLLSPDGISVHALIPNAPGSGTHTSSLAIGTGLDGISGQTGCQACVEVSVTPLQEEIVHMPEPGTGLLLGIPAAHLMLRRRR